MIGTQLSHYLIVEEIGRGGMGVVYRATDTKLERDVAIKVLNSSSGNSKHNRARFYREAKAAARLNHPRIASVYEIGETSQGIDADSTEYPYIVMEYVQGNTLAERLADTRLSCSESIDYCVQIAEALGAAHKKGVVHRDIKPSNIVITGDGTIKIIDFGLALIPDVTITREGSAPGTAGYMSPEQINGDGVDQRTDIWSLGVVFYEMLTGVRPFTGEYEAALLYSIVNHDPEPVSSLTQDVSAAVSKVIACALDKNPATRYHDMEALIRDLKSSDVAAIPASRPVQIRLAILPLENFGGDPDQQYFADGITEEIITNLASINSLQVISRRSVARYRDSTESLSEICRQLDADYIVEGSIFQSGDRARITARLIDSKTDGQVWAGRFDEATEDILALQAAVAREIAQTVAVTLTPVEAGRLRNTRTINPEAYRFYLKGLSLRNVDNPTAWAQAVEMFEASIAIDDSYAPAYAGLVKALTLLCNEANVPVVEAREKMQTAIQKSFKLDPDLSEAHVARAFACWHLGYSYDDAEVDFKRAIELDPSNSSAYYQYGWVLIWRRQFEEAAVMMEKAHELDPLAAISHFGLAQPHFYAGRYDTAIEHCETALALEDNILVAAWTLGMAYTRKGQYDLARSAFQRWGDVAVPVVHGNMTHTLVCLGRTNEAKKVVDDLTARWEQGERGAAYGISLGWAALGEEGRALEWLETAVNERLGIAQWLFAEPIFRTYHGNPKYLRIVERLGLQR